MRHDLIRGNCSILRPQLAAATLPTASTPPCQRPPTVHGTVQRTTVFHKRLLSEPSKSLANKSGSFRGLTGERTATSETPHHVRLFAMNFAATFGLAVLKHLNLLPFPGGLPFLIARHGGQKCGNPCPMHSRLRHDIAGRSGPLDCLAHTLWIEFLKLVCGTEHVSPRANPLTTESSDGHQDPVDLHDQEWVACGNPLHDSVIVEEGGSDLGKGNKTRFRWKRIDKGSCKRSPSPDEAEDKAIECRAFGKRRSSEFLCKHKPTCDNGIRASSSMQHALIKPPYYAGTRRPLE